MAGCGAFAVGQPREVEEQPEAPPESPADEEAVAVIGSTDPPSPGTSVYEWGAERYAVPWSSLVRVGARMSRRPAA